MGAYQGRKDRNVWNNGDLEGHERKDSLEEIKQSAEFFVEEAKQINVDNKLARELNLVKFELKIDSNAWDLSLISDYIKKIKDKYKYNK